MQFELKDEIRNSQGQLLAIMTAKITGDGTTPIVQTLGTSEPIGFNDDGSPILPEMDNNLISKEQQVFMVKAISEQKRLTEMNGLDASTVNQTMLDN